MGRLLNTAVVGAGVAGLAVAALLGRAGHRVTIFDQFDAPRPVGSGLMLQRTGLAVLSAMGLHDSVAARASRIDRLWGVSMPSARDVLNVRFSAYDAQLYALGIQRPALFDVLLAAAQSAGAALESDTAITLEHPHLAGYDLTLLATGARSDILSDGQDGTLAYGALWATLDWPSAAGFDEAALSQRYRAARQMTGVMASGTLRDDAALKCTYFWSLKSSAYASWRAAPLENWKEEAAALWPQTAPLLDQIKDHDDLSFAQYRHYTRPTPIIGPNIVALGDLWHATSPQLGQGANTALLDAWALAKAIAECPNLEDALHSYRQMRRMHVRLYQSLSWLLTPVYQGDSTVMPVLRDWLAAPISAVPPVPAALAALVSGAYGAPLKALGLR